MKKQLALILSFSFLAAVSSAVFAASPILDSLKQQGVQAKALTDTELSEIKGAALIYGQPTPSVTVGMKVHMVTYKGWGSYSDYAAYNYIGNSYNPSNDNVFLYNGGYYRVAGDQWMADTVSSPYSWNAANAQLAEYHYQVLDPNTYAPTAYAFRETAWNRPITKFSW